MAQDKIVYILKSPIGVFAFSEDKNLMHYILFSKNPQTAAEQFNHPISKEFTESLGRCEIRDGEGVIRHNLRELALSLAFGNNAELNEFMSTFSSILSKNSMKGVIGKDKLLIQSFNALDDLTNIINVMSERLREWFGLHYPETRRESIIEDIIKYKRRSEFPNFSKSSGVDIGKKDEEIIFSYASSIKNLEHQRNEMEKYIKETISEICPNVSSVVEPILAVRLLSLAGSLEKFAKMASSTIQLLGAEKALFRHLHNKKHTKPPKYGALFFSAIVQNAPADKKGKVARLLAAKLSIAAKIDFYSGRDEGEKLKKELKDEMKKYEKN
ncbi:MAG: hypothetical protein V1802_00025 [Candidatus Aenigmatarchaeota archaeon]